MSQEKHCCFKDPPPPKEGYSHSKQVLVYYNANPPYATEKWSVAYYHYDPPFNGNAWTDFYNYGKTPDYWWDLPELETFD
jgi:hypothetical protein